MERKLEYPGSLHCHTDYSNFRLRDSINKVDDLIEYAVELGHKMIGITEHETVSSSIAAYECWEKIKETNPDFKVILGNEIYLVRDGLNAENYDRENDRYYHFILLAKDESGHKQIRELSTRAWMRSYKQGRMIRVPTYYSDLIEIIGKNPGHVIGSTACLGGALPVQLMRWNENGNDDTTYNTIISWVTQMEELFGKGNFFLEMQPSKSKEQLFVNSELLKISEKLDIPYIITTDAHYKNKDMRPIHKAYLNSQDGDREVDDFYATTYLMNTEEIESYMLEPLGQEALQKSYSNMMKIYDMCNMFDLRQKLRIPILPWREIDSYSNEEFYLDKMPYLRNFKESEYKEDNYLVKAVINGINNHEDLQNDSAYEELNNCLKDTWVSSEKNNARWSAYFLNLQKTIDYCWEAGTIVGPGRGSGVGFLLLYCLDIIQINTLREKTKTFRFRFLNPDRVSVLDIDTDISGLKRSQVLEYLREKYGNDRVANVLTLGTEKSRSAIQTAARGLGLDVDIARYLSSMIEEDRGEMRTLKQTFYGDEDKGFAPNKQFVFEMTNNYPELWEVAQAIEGLICRVGVHAGGLIFVDEPFTEKAALMKSPNGDVITQFELHTAEKLSLIKIDLLSVEALDRVQTCLELLQEYGKVNGENIREIYEKVIGVYNLERDNEDMWKMLENHEVNALFQMEGQTGVQGIEVLKPHSVDDLAILNSTIRLMPQNKGDEMPTDKCARFKQSKENWIKETELYGLTDKEREVIWPILETSYGMCITQEQFMQLVQLEECGGFDLMFADKLRKAVAKKSPKDYEKITKEFYDTTAEKGCSRGLCRYVWQVLVGASRGYGFNASHTLAYSLVALQELNLAYRFPIIYWNTACLIVDSGGIIEASEDNDEEEDEKKKTKKSTAFGKIATAIGKMQSNGVTIAPPDINNASYSFTPNEENNIIYYGLSGIVRIGGEVIHNILLNRPYASWQDFLSKVKVNKTQMINLIKSGAFDSFGDRIEIMKEYNESICGKKKRLTLQNMAGLISYNLIPETYDFEVRVYNFNKYLKKNKLDKYYVLDDIAFRFYEKHYDVDVLQVIDGKTCILQTKWDNNYQKSMNVLRTWLNGCKELKLKEYNGILERESWNKYCLGSLSKWEMDSVSFYSHEHELSNFRGDLYGVEDFERLPKEPRIENYIYIKDKKIPIFEITRIAGTVLDKDKSKNIITLLTPSGVVPVKLFGPVFTNYDKQISEKGEDGKKKVLEKSWFTRGNKLIFTGIRRGESFFAKKYKRTPYHLCEKIDEIYEDGTISLLSSRYGEEE